MVSIQADSPFPGLHPRRCVGHEADAGEGDHWQPRLWLCRVLQQVRRRGRAQEADLPRFQDPGPPPHRQVGRDQEARRQPRAGRPLNDLFPHEIFDLPTWPYSIFFEQVKSIYVGNLPETGVDESKLKDIFSAYGKVGFSFRGRLFFPF